MADAALYRQIVDVLLAEHEASTPPRPQDETMARKLGVTWGLYCHVHRFARAAMLCARAIAAPDAPIRAVSSPDAAVPPRVRTAVLDMMNAGLRAIGAEAGCCYSVVLGSVLILEDVVIA